MKYSQEYFEDWWEANFTNTYNSEYEESYKELAYTVWQHQQTKIDKLNELIEEVANRADKAIFDNLENLVNSVNLIALAENYLQEIDYIIKGYDEKEYYDIPKDIRIEIEKVTIKYTKFKNKYNLSIVYRLKKVNINLGELTLMYDKEGNFINAHWDLAYNIDDILGD